VAEAHFIREMTTDVEFYPISGGGHVTGDMGCLATAKQPRLPRRVSQVCDDTRDRGHFLFV
jgi:hypothetical protein